MKQNQTKIKPPRVVMVETSHPGNIGAAARAMKTMCVYDLGLVHPKEFPSPVAFARASGAADILENAQQYDSLTAAIADCQKVVGITARNRKISAPVVTPKQLIQEMSNDLEQTDVAWVFGRERNGLNNDEIDLCTCICTIPSNSEYGSLNIAAAIQILCYEWHATESTALQKDTNSDALSAKKIAPVGEREGFYEHLWQTLEKIEFLDKDNPTPLMRKMRRLFDRSQLTSAEINILRGVFKNIIKQ
ncbi:MAG: RNA methyltransferase [Gammaproteobacteria bacterium]|nr:RNA methyltransferase [Gammaproteobacteria bacterium]